tara:strand:- start:1015 stop:1272 length:258 start_codon:yes stop_codon:yes gene_type:complete
VVLGVRGERREDGKLAFETDSRPEFFGELELLGVGLEVVDVYITILRINIPPVELFRPGNLKGRNIQSSSSAIIEWFGEAFIALA